MAKQTTNVFSTQYPSGMAFVGILLLGIGIGLFVKLVWVFTLIALGVGFLAVALMSASTKNKRIDR